MELLIPGLILVALMVYASTRIKRIAAQAFEAETIETADFRIEKPDGFLNVIGGDPQFEFEAYSKDFGGDGAGNIRRATANVIRKSSTSVDDVSREISGGDGERIADLTESRDDVNYRIIKRRMTENETEYHVFSKVAARDTDVFIFTVKFIAETTPDFMRNIEAMFSSFELK